MLTQRIQEKALLSNRTVGSRPKGSDCFSTPERMSEQMSEQKVDTLIVVVVCLISTLTCAGLARNADKAASLEDADHNVAWLEIPAIQVVFPVFDKRSDNEIRRPTVSSQMK